MTSSLILGITHQTIRKQFNFKRKMFASFFSTACFWFNLRKSSKNYEFLLIMALAFPCFR